MVDDRVTTSKLEHYLNLTKMAREKATRIHEEVLLSICNWISS